MTRPWVAKLKWIFLALLLASSLAIVAMGIEISNFGLHAPSPPRGDYILVLGAKTSNGGPLPAYRQRILHGIALHRQGLAEKIIFTGRPGNPPQAQVAKNLALEMGVAEANILIETESMNTWENLFYARKLVEAPGSSVVLIVSDPFHLKRAVRMAKDLGLNARPAPVPDSAFRSVRSQLRLLVREVFAYYYYLFFKRP